MSRVSDSKLLHLLKAAATLEIVRKFLKQRGLPSTASSWDQMIDDRLSPRLESGELTVPELVSLLRDCEEHGRQHVFLYRPANGYKPACVVERTLKTALTRMDLLSLLDSPRYLDLPSTPQLVDVRRESLPRKAVVVKGVERRTYLEYAGQKASNGQLTKTYNELEERAVNVARVRSDGLIEIRIFRQRTSTDYTEPLLSFAKLIKPLLDLAQCEEISLVVAKRTIWERGPQLSDRIRINQQWARNPFGTESRLISQNDSRTLADDSGSLDSMHAFMALNGQHTACHATWILEDGPPEVVRHVALHGRPHEYALGQACTRAQYEQILEDILSFNA